MDNPDVIASVDRHTYDGAKNPLLGSGLGHIGSTS
jgi:hypothetical protein